MSATFQAYDPAQVIVTVGVRSISGYADGTFVRVSREVDSFTKYVGSDGTVARTKSNNYSGSITITLMQTSPDNDYLTNLLALAETANAQSLGVFNVKITDKTGTSVFSSANAWIRKYPDVDYARDISTREWVIDVDRLEMVVGGNSQGVLDLATNIGRAVARIVL